jgi:hypothetical protein
MVHSSFSFPLLIYTQCNAVTTVIAQTGAVRLSAVQAWTQTQMHCVRAPDPYPREKSVSDRNRERAKGRAVHLTTVVSWSPFFFVTEVTYLSYLSRHFGRTDSTQIPLFNAKIYCGIAPDKVRSFFIIYTNSNNFPPHAFIVDSIFNHRTKFSLCTNLKTLINCSGLSFQSRSKQTLQ